MRAHPLEQPTSAGRQFLTSLLLQYSDKVMQMASLLKTAQAEGRDITTAELDALFGTSHYKPISLICPMFNEAAGAVATARLTAVP